MAGTPGTARSKKRIPLPFLALGGVVLVFIVIATTVWFVPSMAEQKQSPQADTSIHSVSPLLFGTNLGLFNAQDQVLNSAITRDQLKKLNTKIIRMPLRESLPDEVEIKAAETIKSMGITPLIILRGAAHPNVMPENIRLITAMNQVFGDSLVYYEYGNENDLEGVSAEKYTASWNQNVPQLKKLAKNAHFIGPVNFQYSRNYLSYFLQNAKPRADEVSWHEYTCDNSWAKSLCIERIGNWTKHMVSAREVMRATIGVELPIMITEWNYAPNAVPNDDKTKDTQFLTTWTKKALETLAANRIFAAMQYSCTNTAIPMVNSSQQVTAQGSAFQQSFEALTKGQVPPVIEPKPSGGSVTPTVVATPASKTPVATPVSGQNGKPIGSVKFSFETGGVEDWRGKGRSLTGIERSTTIALDGKSALKFSLSNAASNDYPYISVTNKAITFPSSGQTISASVYITGNNEPLSAKVFVRDGNYMWHQATPKTLSANTWNTLTYTVPADVVGEITEIGVQFNFRTNSVAGGTVYMDALAWN